MSKRRRLLPTNLAALKVTELRKISAAIHLPLTAKDTKASIIVKIQKQESMKKKMREFCRQDSNGIKSAPGTPGKRSREKDDRIEMETPTKKIRPNREKTTDRVATGSSAGDGHKAGSAPTADPPLLEDHGRALPASLNNSETTNSQENMQEKPASLQHQCSIQNETSKLTDRPAGTAQNIQSDPSIPSTPATQSNDESAGTRPEPTKLVKITFDAGPTSQGEGNITGSTRVKCHKTEGRPPDSCKD